MKFYVIHLLLTLILLMSTNVAFAQKTAGDSANGKFLFDHQCSLCHSLTINRAGPILAGVYGRKAGHLSDFSYSMAVKNSGVIWEASSLDKWLTSPSAFIPGTRMAFNVSDPQKRADIIAYLKTVSPTEK